MSRLTFRDPAGDVAYQRQLRDSYVAQGTPPVPHLDLAKTRVREVSYRFAENIILRYEWLGTMAKTSRHYGIFFGDECAGVCCVSIPPAIANTKPHEEFGIERRELALLARGACVHWAPTGTNSRLVSLTCKLLAKDVPGAKLIIAYSDVDAGEIGTIYQACNWDYIGKTYGKSHEIISPGGRAYNTRVIGTSIDASGMRGKIHWTEQRDAMLAAGWRTQDASRKHKYAYILDKSDRLLAARIARMRLPYPKRATHVAAKVSESTAPCVASIDGDASVYQAEEEGSRPIATLQESPDSLMVN